jgi:hypothetical protein
MDPVANDEKGSRDRSAKSGGGENQFFVSGHRLPEANGEFSATSPECLDKALMPYFGRVLYHLNRQSGCSGLRFFVTTTDFKELPDYSPNTVLCILEDEQSREPSFRDRIGHTFRCYPAFPCHADGIHGLKLKHRVIANYVVARDFLKGFPGRLSTLKSILLGRDLCPITEIPLGCAAYHPGVDFIPFEERAHDLYFAGSIGHEAGHRIDSWVAKLRLKSAERLGMKEALDAIAKEEPGIRVHTKFTGSFHESVEDGNESYLRDLMNSKFCLTPRGGVPHTYRFFEALRYGCIPIGETFPGSVEGAPFIRLKQWSDLPGVLPDLLADQTALLQMHAEAIEWWEKNASEEFTARLMLDSLVKSGLASDTGFVPA